LARTIRIHTDGSIPADNPFIGRKGALPDIWSYGHRNMQGAALSPKAGNLWTTEHGARGGDELNIDRAGANYGWPVITWGRDYSGLKIGEGTSKQGMAQPVVYWTPSIAPSGLMFYTGDVFAQWHGMAFVGSLKFGYLNRLTLEGNKVVQQTKMLEDIGDRVRDVEQGPDGLIYVATDEAYGRILRIEPK
jgi:glucose/arabinose dehydrogenase